MSPTYRSLFDGRTLSGWTAVPRSYGTTYPGGPRVLDVATHFPKDYQATADAHPAAWTVEDGALVGRQQPSGSGYGGYLVSNETFGDFELEVDARPDWPADTGIMVRRCRDTWEGLQVLVDHRESGSIGGFYGNGIGGFHAVPFVLSAVVDAEGVPQGLREETSPDSVEPFSDDKRAMLTRACSADEFLAVWRWADWNTFRIRSVGELPLTTVYVNDLLVAEIDLATLAAPNYDSAAASRVLGRAGHIAFEVHDNDPLLGQARWAVGAACRWRNVRVREL